MRINHNISALNTHRQMGANQLSASKNMEKLSSGLKINRAGDDAAGLAISEKMRAQVKGLDMATKNAQDGISLIQTAEGALNETHSILQRMRELAVQSANDTNTNEDRAELQKEVDQLSQEITRISTDTEFNTQKLINGTAEGITFHIGANEGQNIQINIDDMGAEALEVAGKFTTANMTTNKLTLKNTNDGQTYSVKIDNGAAATAAGGANPNGTEFKASFDKATGAVTVTLGTEWDAAATPPASKAITSSLDDVVKKINDLGIEGLTVSVTEGTIGTTVAQAEGAVNVGVAATVDESTGINISSQSAASAAITTINAAIETVSAQRSNLGAVQNRLEHTINNLGTSSENLTAAESRIRDVDMAKEMMEMTKNNILSQASQAMLAQANQQPQGVLQLLQ